MKTLYTIYTNFAKRVLMALALITMGVSTAWGEETTITWNFESVDTQLSNLDKEPISVSYAKNNGTNEVAISSSAFRLYKGSNSSNNGCSVTFTIANGYKIESITVVFKDGRTSARGKIDNGSYEDVFSAGDSKTVTISSLSAQSYSIQNQGSSTVAITSITITYSSNTSAPAELYTVTLKDDNSTLTQSTAGESITLPSRDGCDGYTFAGWTKSWTTNQTSWTTTAPEIIPAGDYTPTEDVSLYPVYTKAVGGGTTQYVLTDITSIVPGDIFVLADASDYAMTNNNGTNNGPSPNAITISNNKITSSVDATIEWQLTGNATDGYTFYPASGTSVWLYCNTTASSGSNNNMRVGTGNRKLFVVNNKGYLVTNDDKTDRYLSRYDENGTPKDFRGYINTNTNPVQPKLYKKTGGSTTYYISVPNCCTQLAEVINLVFSGITSNSITIGVPDTYSDKANVSGYTFNCYSALTGSSIVATVDEAGTSHTFSELTPNTTYYFTVIAKGEGDYCNSAETSPRESSKTLAQYTVTLNPNGGTGTFTDWTASGDNYTKTVEAGTAINLPTPSKTGYDFAGWHDGTTTVTSSYTPTKDITLYAQWEEKKLINFRTLCEYTITWELAGGQIDGNTDDIVDTYTNGQVIQKPADPTRVGHRFLGWTPDFVEGTKMQSQSLVYTAQWFELIVTQLQWSEDYYTATMEADNDFPDLTILPNDFAGELTYQSSNPAVATIAADGTITLIGTGTTTIKASIAADDTYLAASDSYELTVVESNCKWVEVTIDQIQYGDEIIIAVPGKDAYGADMLYMLQDPQAAQNPKVYQMNVSDLLNTDNVAATVIWNIRKRDDNQANFTVYRNGSTTDRLTFVSDPNVRVGSTSSSSADSIFTITNEGYFKSAYLNRYLRMSGSDDWRHYPTNTTQPFKFYKRVCLNSEYYWLTWDATDGQFADGSKQIVKDYAVGTTINKPLDPTRTGYELAGWSTDGVNVVTPADKMPKENLSYSAVWQIKSYTVTWDADGGQFANGETVIEQTYEYGATITKPANPTRTGYTFKGWSPNVPDKMSTDNLKFVAQWQVNQYTVTWIPGEGGHWGNSFAPIVENYNYGDPINKPTNPEKAGYVFDKWEPDVVATMPNNNLTYTAKWNEAFCDAFTFHTGNADVWNNPQEQICFEFKANHEWQIINYVIPIFDAQSHFLVADKGWPQRDQGSLGGHSKSATSTWSATMYLAPSVDSNDGNGSPKVGHAKGAVGTLRIFDDSNWDNLYVGFIPNGYKLKFGANEYDFIHHEDAEYRSEIVEYNATTANNNVSVGVINTSNAYVKTDHTQEGMRHIFLKDNVGWKADGAKIAIYYFNSDSDNGWSNFMKEVPGETDMYEGWIPENYSKVIFVRLNPDGGINWDAKWNQTGNLTLQTDKTLYTIPSGKWDGADDTNWSTYQRKGKFRIYNNSWDKNWYVHFYPHYVITFDKNAADATGTMQPQALPLDANPKTIVLNQCGFERRGYDFTDWKTDVAITADGTNVAANGNVKDKATISNINKDITLKAQWKAQAYTVNYKDQGDVAYSGENSASLPQTHTYDQMTTLVAGVKTGYTFGGWYLTPECDGTAVTDLGAKDYTEDITLYAKWTFAMEYNITNTVPIYITSAVGQTIKATAPLTLTTSNMPIGTVINIAAPNIKFYHGSEEVTELTTKYTNETFSLTIAYTPTTDNTTEQPTITLSVLGNEKTFDGLIFARSLPANFVIAAKWGNNWYAMPANMDSQSSTEGLLIEVDNPSDPTKALAAPSNAPYSLKSVKPSKFATQGERLVFVGIGDKTLYNAAGTSIQVYAQYANYDNDRYEWIPTTTDLKDYTLTSAAVLAGDGTGRTVSLDNHGIFGTLLQDKSYNGMVRLLPVDNFYEPIELQVVEWKQHSVSVMYTGAGTKYTTKVGNNAESSVQALPAIDQAVYSLSTSDLATATNQPLIITIKDDADATIGTVKLTIPAVVATDKSSTALGVTAEIAKATSIVVLDGVTLTADVTKYTYDDVTVYPGGKLVIGQSGQLGMYTLTLRAGSTWGAADYEHKYPQFVLNNSATGAYSNTSGQINLDYVTTQDYYYPLSVPEQVTIADIKYPVEIYGSNVDKANKGSFQLKYYDGAQRVAQGSQYGTGWVVVDEKTTTTLTPNQGYAIWGIPKKINGTRQTYGIHRIPIKKAAGDLATNEKTNAEIPIKAHGINDANVLPNDKGWNYLGNPYLAGLGGMDGTDDDLQMGLLVQEKINGQWTGGWVNNGAQVRYVTLTNDCQTFEAIPVAEAQIPAFTTFFIQAAQDGAVLLTPPANAVPSSLAARQYAAQQETSKEITTGVLLMGNDQIDRTGLLIADNFTEEYEFNADLSKFENSGINLYTIGKTGNLAYMAINQALAEQAIPVGYTAPAEGLYTVAFDEDRYNATDISALYLIDYDSNEKTNLLHTDYSFVTAAGTNNQRFALQVAFVPANSTNVEWVGDATIQVGVEGHELILNNLPTDAAVHVFDALGRLMYYTPHAPTEMQLTLPTGYYLVRIADKQHAAVINTVIP